MTRTVRDQVRVGSFCLHWLRALQDAISRAGHLRAAARNEGKAVDGPDRLLTATDLQICVAATRWIVDDSLTFFRSQDDFAADCGITNKGAAKCLHRIIENGFLVEVPGLKRDDLKGRPAKSYRAQIPDTLRNGRSGKSISPFRNGSRGKHGDFPEPRGEKGQGVLSGTTVGGLSPTRVSPILRDYTTEVADAPSGARRPAPSPDPDTRSDRHHREEASAVSEDEPWR